VGEDSAVHAALNRNKRSVVVDIRQEAGASVVKRLAAKADVLVEAFRPGVLAKHGLGAPELRRENPRLVYCSLTGYGQDGPMAARAGHDVDYIALGGLLGTIRDAAGRPVLPATQVADMTGGLLATVGIWPPSGAGRGGRGQVVDVSCSRASAIDDDPGRPAPAGGALPNRLAGTHACWRLPLQRRPLPRGGRPRAQVLGVAVLALACPSAWAGSGSGPKAQATVGLARIFAREGSRRLGPRAARSRCRSAVLDLDGLSASHRSWLVTPWWRRHGPGALQDGRLADPVVETRWLLTGRCPLSASTRTKCCAPGYGDQEMGPCGTTGDPVTTTRRLPPPATERGADGIVVITLDAPGEKVKHARPGIGGSIQALMARSSRTASGIVIRSGKPDNFVAGPTSRTS
jgi:hypothetical protein